LLGRDTTPQTLAIIVRHDLLEPGKSHFAPGRGCVVSTNRSVSEQSQASGGFVRCGAYSPGHVHSAATGPARSSAWKKEFGPQTTQNDTERQRIPNAGPATQPVGGVSSFKSLIIRVFCVFCGLNCRI
jgi:hypothetical protein